MSHLAAVIGWPVNRSLSPAIHNAAFAMLGLDWSFAPIAIRPDSLAEGMELLDALQVEGASVTMPHKLGVIGFCSNLTPRAQRLGAVNTLSRTEGGWEGDNTDGEGFLRFLHEDADLRPRSALVVGAGGAARAVAVALADEGVDVTVAARRAEAAEEVAGLAERIGTASWGRRVACDLVVQTTPVRDDSLPAAYRAFPKGRAAVELAYGAPTAFLQAAEDAGAPSYDGLGMLIRQAALAFERWTGLSAPIAAMRQAAGSALLPRI